MKRVIILFTALMMIITLFAGCSKSTANNGNTGAESGNASENVTKPEAQSTSGVSETAKEKKQVNITIAIFGSEAQKTVYDGILAEGLKEKSHIKTEVVLIPYAEYQKKLSVLKAAGEAPDIAWLADAMIPQFLEYDQLIDISNIKNDESYDFSDIIPSTLDMVTKGGKLYGIPFSTPPLIMYYNKTLFDRKGVKTPNELYKEGKWNYDEFISACRQLTDKSSGTYGYVGTSPADFLNSWIDYIWGYGAEPFGNNASEFTLNSEGGRKALQMCQDLFLKYEACPLPGQPIDFASGKIGMARTTVKYMSKLKGTVEFEWGIAPMPEGPSKGSIQMGYSAYVVLSDRAPEEDRLTVLKILTNKGAFEAAAKFFIPSRKSIVESDTLADNYPVDKQVFKDVILGSMQKGRILITHKNYAKIKTEIQTGIESMIFEKTSVEEVLNEMDKRIKPLLDEKIE